MVRYLNVQYSEKDKVKLLGARWSPEKKRWYYESDEPVQAFAKWEAGFKPKAQKLTFDDLSDEQKDFILKAKKGGNILVDACIGSGKTTAIQVLCDVLSDKSILYLTYNKLLKNDAQEKIKSERTHVQNYHGLAYECLSRLDAPLGISDLIQNILKLKPDMGKFDILILDEYQDIEQELAEMLTIIKEQNPNMQLIAVGDMKQKIYDKTTLSVPEFISKFLGSYEVLHFTKCFRLNAEFAARLGRIWNKEIVGVNENCEIETMKIEKVAKFLARQDTSDILCLGKRTGAITKVLNKLEDEYPDKFNKNTVYASIRDADGNTGNVQPTSTTAIFTTFDSSKGLERPICVIFDYNFDYWDTRLNQPMTDYEVLRNIFCVAASRGKKKIIFVKNEKKLPLKDSDLAYPPKEKEVEFRKPFPVAEMFDFKFKEDVEECYSMLKIQKKAIKDSKIIDIKDKDGLIDLSPCIGIYQEAMYFDNYSIDSEIAFSQAMHPDRPPLSYDADFPLQKKVLYLVAYETYQDRYIEQLKVPFISPTEEKEISDRLGTMLTKKEQVQRRCSIPFYDNGGNSCVIEGRADVIKDNTVYELKFVSDVSHEHFLQTAVYMVALNIEKGVLWNVRTNTMYTVRVPDKEKFIEKVIKCITKGNIKKYYPA